MRGFASQNNNYPVFSRMMLRFRPIAPKPVAGDAPPAAAELLEKRNGGGTNIGRRSKRKYVRVRARTSKKKNSSANGKSSPHGRSGTEPESPPEKGVVTLQLLPERSEVDLNSCTSITTVDETQENNWKILDLQFKLEDGVDCKLAVDSGAVGGGSVASRGVRSVIETWIIVECVTDAYMDGGVGLGFSDSEKIGNLEADACPGFVSDGTNKVVWINEAYRKMAAEGDEVAVNGILVWLVVKEKLPHFCPSFACRVRMIQHTRDGQKWNRIVPCDVWRMDFAGFAWKLDVNTALGLGI